MPQKCFNCSSKIGLHSAPLTEEYRKIWRNIIPNIKANDIDYRSFKLCSKHFKDQYLTTSKRLTRHAIPSKFVLDDNMWYTIEYNEDAILNDPTQIINYKKPRGNEISCNDNSTNIKNEPPNYHSTSIINTPQNYSLTSIINTPSNYPSTSIIKTPPKYPSTLIINTPPNYPSTLITISPPIKIEKSEDIKPATPQGSDVISCQFRYTGDIDASLNYSPRTSKRAITKLKEELAKIRRENKALITKCNRYQRKVQDFENFMMDLEKEGIISGGPRECKKISLTKRFTNRKLKRKV